MPVTKASNLLGLLEKQIKINRVKYVKAEDSDEFTTEEIDEESDELIPINELYQQFIFSGMDYAGQLSAGYNDWGTQMSFEIGVDFAQLIAPFGPLSPITLGVDTTVDAQRSQRVLLIVQRQPNAFAQHKPICLMRMRGAYKKLQLGVSVRAEVGYSSEDIASSLGIDQEVFTLEATAGVTAGVSGDVDCLYVIDGNPLWYGNWQDSDLIDNFRTYAGKLQKAQAKGEAILTYQKWSPSHDKKREGYPSLDLINKLNTLKASSDISSSSQAVAEIDNAVLNLSAWRFYDPKKAILSANQWLQTKYVSVWTALNADRKTAGVMALGANIDDVNFMITGLMEALQGIKARETAASTSGATQKYSQRYSDALAIKNRLQAIKENMALPDQPLAYLRLYTFGGGGGVSASATLAAKVTFEPAEGGLELSAEAGASGHMARTDYRYQTQTNNNTVMTQDTVIRYDQVTLTASASAKAITVKAGEKSVEGEYSYNWMSYRSAVAFWKRNSASPVCLPGSGICFGVSFQYSDLLNKLKTQQSTAQPTSAASQQTTAPAASTGGNVFNSLANQLRLPVAALQNFVSQSWLFAADASPSYLPTDAIIIETAWAANNSPLAYDPKKNGELQYLLTGWNNVLTTKAVAALPQSAQSSYTVNDPTPNSNLSFTLQSIACRYRLADMEQEEKMKFKLGVVLAPVSLGIQLNKVYEAGTHAVVDLDTWWLDASKNNNSKDAYEGAVPRVAIFHQ